jgi:hypothetical protein
MFHVLAGRKSKGARLAAILARPAQSGYQDGDGIANPGSNE